MNLQQILSYREVLAGGPPSDKGPGSGHYQHEKSTALDQGTSDRVYRALAQQTKLSDYGGLMTYYVKNNLSTVINKRLRGLDVTKDLENGPYDEMSSEELDGLIKEVDNDFQKSAKPAPEDFIVHRGVGLHHISFSSLKPGDVITDRAYTSASLNPGHAAGFARGSNGVVVQIVITKGTPVVAVQDPKKERVQYGQTNKESEVILGKGQQFRVLSVSGKTAVLQTILVKKRVEAGGQGSGCHGPNCGRPSEGKSQILYRGAESPELGKGQFGGVFLSTDRKMAGQYGKVYTYEVTAKNFLDFDDKQAEALSNQYLEEHPDDAPNYDPIDEPGAPSDLWLFPTPGWISFLKSKGFEGTTMGSDHFVFDAAKVHHVAQPEGV